MKKHSKPISTASVLVVDDEVLVRETVSRFLNEIGCEVFTAESARRALEIARERRIDLALLDIHLGDLSGSEMDGLELCRTLKNDPATTDIPVIMLTVHGDLQHILSSTKAGAADFIVKPWTAETLRSKISKYIGASDKAAESDPPAKRRRGSGLASRRPSD